VTLKLEDVNLSKAARPTSAPHTTIMTCTPSKDHNLVSDTLTEELSGRLAKAFQEVRTLQSDVTMNKRRWLESESSLEQECVLRAKLEVGSLLRLTRSI